MFKRVNVYVYYLMEVDHLHYFVLSVPIIRNVLYFLIDCQNWNSFSGLSGTSSFSLNILF